MNPKIVLLTAVIGMLSLGINCFAQEKTEEEKALELNNSIQKKIEEQERLFELEGWQTFYLDSIYTHDYFEMNKELESMNKSKVNNYNLYVEVQDKWEERMYQAVHQIFNEQQWNRYLKSGAAAAKKARDKRKAKKESK